MSKTSPMSNIAYYLLEDHPARQHTLLVGAGICLILGTIAQAFGFSINITAGICFAAAGIVEITRAVKYTQPSRRGKIAVAVLPGRRQLLYSALSAASFFILVRLSRFAAHTVERKLTESSTDPANPQSVKEVKQVLDRAQTAGIKIPADVLQIAGTKFLQASERNPEAWDAIAALLGYRTFLNVNLSPAAHETFGRADSNSWQITAIIELQGKGPGTLTATYPNRLVPASQAFVFQRRGEERRLTNQGHPYVRITGTGEAILDDIELRNVIFDGVKIGYDGGPISMENVYFVNCKFELKQTIPTRLFAQNVLEHVPTTFEYS
jgi:hypothetical protein